MVCRTFLLLVCDMFTLLLIAVVGQVTQPPDPRAAFATPPVVVAATPAADPVRAVPSAAWPIPSARVFVQSSGELRPPQRHTVKFTDPPISPNELYERALLALQDPTLVQANRAFETRFITHWPVQLEQQPALERALYFWIASLSNRRVFVPPKRIPNLGWRVYLSDYDWDAAAWEALTSKSPYFAVSTFDKKGQINRGWLDPTIETNLRLTTGAARPIERADRFLALTSLDVGDQRGGVYSKFLRLPNKEAALFKQFGVDEKFLQDNSLLRGGAVLGGGSIVALHNRELQLLPSPVGLDEGFLWRSLDTATDEGDQSVVKNFSGSIRINGGEYIGSLRNGLHYYYLVNAAKNQVPVVPVDIAQDKTDLHDTQVHSPYKCVKCHGPKSGIRHFDDVVARMSLNPKVALSVIQKYPEYAALKLENTTRLALEDYYLSPLAEDIVQHQESYAQALLAINGLQPAANTDNYLQFVEQYLFQLVDRNQAAYELAVDIEQLDEFLKQTGNDELMTILASERIPRSLFEAGFSDGMKARIYPWERSPVNVIERQHVQPPVAKPPVTQPPAATTAKPKPVAPVQPMAIVSPPVRPVQPVVVPVVKPPVHSVPAGPRWGWRR
jgi:hypothetical protein